MINPCHADDETIASHHPLLIITSCHVHCRNAVGEQLNSGVRECGDNSGRPWGVVPVAASYQFNV